MLRGGSLKSSGRIGCVTHRYPRRPSVGRRWARPCVACGPWPRSCTWTSPRWPWTRSPTRGPRTATCSAARRRCPWSFAPREVLDAPSLLTIPNRWKRSGYISLVSTSSCPAPPTTPRGCSRRPFATITRSCSSSTRCSTASRAMCPRRITSSPSVWPTSSARAPM